MRRRRGSDVWPAPAVHNSLSSVLVALTTERDRLRDLHQGSELSRMAVSSGTWQLTGGRAWTEMGLQVPSADLCQGSGIDRGCS